MRCRRHHEAPVLGAGKTTLLNKQPLSDQPFGVADGDSKVGAWAGPSAASGLACIKKITTGFFFRRVAPHARARRRQRAAACGARDERAVCLSTKEDLESAVAKLKKSDSDLRSATFLNVALEKDLMDMENRWKDAYQDAVAADDALMEKK